jgi:hypothetical protein
MTDEQKAKCDGIIQKYANKLAITNHLTGIFFGTVFHGARIADDTVRMTAMTRALAAVFGLSIPRKVAKGIAIAAKERTSLKQPILTPIWGFPIFPNLKRIEAVGWDIVQELENITKKE